MEAIFVTVSVSLETGPRSDHLYSPYTQDEPGVGADTGE